jgi:DNA repair protein RadC
LAQNIFTLFKVTEVELIYRNKVKPSERQTITTPEDAYDIFLKAWDMNKIDLVEQFSILLLDRSNHCLGISNIATGGISSCIVDPKIIYSTALKARASGLILAHNHPSGGLNPSTSDIALTQKLKEGARLLDMTVADHLIVTPHSFFSFASEGLML